MYLHAFSCNWVFHILYIRSPFITYISQLSEEYEKVDGHLIRLPAHFLPLKQHWPSPQSLFFLQLLYLVHLHLEPLHLFST